MGIGHRQYIGCRGCIITFYMEAFGLKDSSFASKPQSFLPLGGDLHPKPQSLNPKS